MRSVILLVNSFSIQGHMNDSIKGPTFRNIFDGVSQRLGHYNNFRIATKPIVNGLTVIIRCPLTQLVDMNVEKAFFLLYLELDD